MEFELWYLILVPILFGAGWYAHSFDQKEKKSTSDETKTLYRGLDLLLSNKKDQAIDSFINLVKTDPDTIEMHYSLGALFRRRGEFDRAIRIHNHLANRGDLPKKEHNRAIFELGEDYLKAGLWDRAEATFVKLTEKESSYQALAARKLIFIYESEKEWQKAIHAAQMLEKISSEMMPSRIGHLYCELAEQCLHRGKAEEAVSYINEALKVDSHHKRALFMLGNLQEKSGKLAEAIETWLRLGEINPDYETLVVSRIANGLITLGDKERALQYLTHIVEKGKNIDELDSAVQVISKVKSPEEAIELIQKRLEKRPSLMGFQRLLELSQANEPENKQIAELSRLLKQQVDKVARYQCTKCGFATTRFQWLCPGCRQWESMPPIRSEKVVAR